MIKKHPVKSIYYHLHLLIIHPAITQLCTDKIKTCHKYTKYTKCGQSIDLAITNTAPRPSFYFVMLLAVHTSLEDWLHFPYFKKLSQENILLLSYVLQWPNVSFCRKGFRLPHIPKQRRSMKHARSHPAVHECYWPEIFKGQCHRFAFKQISNCRNYIRYSILCDERPQMVRVDLTGVIQCAAYSMALSFHLLGEGGRGNPTE